MTWLLALLDLRVWRSSGRPVRALRAALLLVVAIGITPGAAEIVEVLEHVVHDGHLPHGAEHSEAASDEEHGTNDEHGCTPTAHHCGCCASLPVTSGPAAPGFEAPPLPVAVRTLRAHDDATGPRRGTPPPVRPPIA